MRFEALTETGRYVLNNLTETGELVIKRYRTGTGRCLGSKRMEVDLETIYASESIPFRKLERPIQETVTTSDSIPTRTLRRSILEHLLVLDTTTKQLYRSFLENITVVDSVPTRKLLRAIVEQIFTTDTISSRKLLRTIVETITILDTVTKSLKRVFSESLRVFDSYTKVSLRLVLEVVLKHIKPAIELEFKQAFSKLVHKLSKTTLKKLIKRK